MGLSWNSDGKYEKSVLRNENLRYYVVMKYIVLVDTLHNKKLNSV